MTRTQLNLNHTFIVNAWLSPSKEICRIFSFSFRQLSIILLALVFFVQNSNAQVITDPLAPIQFRPSITSSSNGTPVVDITAPSFGGISHNKFQRYNIDLSGLILNNSKLTGVSIIGGQVKANANLTNQQPAKIILNEVTSSAISTLNGPTEVFGTKADVIIANPNGIGCIGCTFINSGKITLSTGTPVIDYNRGNVNFDVRRGTISISGAGLSAANGASLQDIDLIGRQISLNAPVVSDSVVRIRSGGMIYQPSGDTIAALDSSLLSTVTGPAISSSSAGSIKAGSLSILSRDTNIGVTLAGDLQTTASSLNIRSYGDLELAAVRSAGDIGLEADGTLVLSGKGFALGRITAGANKIDLALNTNLLANDALILQAIQSLTVRGILKAGTDISIISKEDLVASGIIAANGDVAFEAQRLSTSYLTASGASVTTSGIQSVNLVGSTFVSTSQNVTVSGQNIDLDVDTKFQANAMLVIDAKNQLTNAALLNYSNLDLSVKNSLINTVTGQIIQDNLSLPVNNEIINYGHLYGLITTSLKTRSLTNQSSGIIYGPSVSINIPNDFSNQGQILADNNLSIQSGIIRNNNLIQASSLTVNSVSYENDSSGAKLAAQTAQLIVSGDLSNSGSITGIDRLSLTISGTVHNSGSIQSAGTLTIASDSYSANIATALVFGKFVTFQTAHDANNTGSILGLDQLSLDIGGILNNSGAIQTNGVLTASGNSYVAPSSAAILSGRTVTLTIAKDITNAGKIQALSDLTLLGGGTLSNSGTLAATNSFAITLTGDITNLNTVSAETLRISASRYDGSSASNLNANSLTLVLNGDFTNAGKINAATDLTLTTAKFSNQVTGTLLGDLITITAQQSLANAGLIQATGAVNLNIIGDIINSGTLQSLGGLTLTASGTLQNSGTLQAHTNLNLSIDSIINSATAKIQANMLNAKAVHDINNSGVMLVDTLLSITAANLLNSGSSASNIASILASNLSFTLTGDLINGAYSLLRANDSASLSSATISSHFLSNTTTAQGLFAFANNLGLTLTQSGYTFDTDYKTTGNVTLTTSGDIVNTVVIGVGGKLTLKSTQGSIFNKEGAAVFSGSDMSLYAANNITNTSAIIQSLANLNINAGGEYSNSRSSNILIQIYDDYNVNYKFANCCWHEHHIKQIEGSAAAVTDVQGTMTVQANSVINLASTITVGGDLIIQSASFDNAQRALTDTVQGFRDSCSGCTKGLRYTNYLTYYTPSEVTVAGNFNAANTQNFSNSGSITSTTANINAPTLVVGITGVTIPAAPARLPDPVIDLSRLSSVSTLQLKPGTAPSFQSSPDGNQTVTFLHSIPVNSQTVDRNPTWILAQLNVTNGNLIFFADPFTEQRLIAQSLLEQTGRSLLDPRYKNPKAQQEALYQATVDFIKANPTVNFGTELTESQRKAVTKPLLWYVKRVIDGQEVLVPELILPETELASYKAVAVGSIAATDITLTGDKITNTGNLLATNALSITAGEFSNIKRVTTAHNGASGFEAGALLSAKSIAITTRRDMISLGGTLLASKSLSIDAGGNLIVGAQTAVSTVSYGSKRNWSIVHDVTNLGSVLSSGGDLHLASNNTLSIQGSTVTALGKADLYGEKAVQITSVLDEHDVRSGGKKSGFLKTSSFSATDHSITNVISVVSAGTDLTVQSGGSIGVKASTLSAGRALTLLAGVGPNAQADVSVSISAGLDTRDTTYSKKSSGFGVFTGGGSVDFYRSSTTKNTGFSVENVASALTAGGALVVGGKQDVTVIGSALSATGLTTLTAGRDLTLLPSYQAAGSTSSTSSKGIGFSFSSGDGGGSLSAGFHATTDKSAGAGRLAAPTSVYGGQGVVMNAGRDAFLQAVDISSPKAVTLTAGQNLTLLPGVNTAQNSQTHSEVMAGISIKVSQTVTSALQQLQSAPSTFNSGHGGAVYQAIGQASGIMQAVDGLRSLSNPSVSASLTLGASGTQSSSSAATSTVRPSTLVAGTDLTVQAGRDVHLQAVQAQAGRALSVTAGRDLVIESGQSTAQAQQSSSRFSAGVGVSGSCSLAQGCSGGLTGSVAGAESSAKSQSVTQVNSALVAGGPLSLKSDNDTTIAGAVVRGDSVGVTVGNHLTLASRQDTASSNSQSVNASASLTIGAGTSGSVGVGGSQGSTDKAWVTQQTSVIANDNLNVTVKNHTQIDGALVNSKTGNLALDTGTLGASTIKDHDTGSQVSGQANIGGSSSKDAKGQTQNTGSGTVSGSLETWTRTQDTKATIGAGAVTIRDPAKSATSQLNRDVAQAQVITQDTSAGVKVYLSSEAVKEIASGFAETRANLAASQKALAEAFAQVPSAIRNVIADAVSSIDLKDKSTQEIAKETIDKAVAAGKMSAADAPHIKEQIEILDKQIQDNPEKANEILANATASCGKQGALPPYRQFGQINPAATGIEEVIKNRFSLHDLIFPPAWAQITIPASTPMGLCIAGGVYIVGKLIDYYTVKPKPIAQNPANDNSATPGIGHNGGPSLTPETPTPEQSPTPEPPQNNPYDTAKVAALLAAAKAANWQLSNGSTLYPPNDGFAAPPVSVTLPQGTRIDRYGDNQDADFFAPPGTTLPQRALPPGAEARPLVTYEVLKPLPVQSGPIQSWFGQPGGGTQFKTDMTVEKLIKDEFIRIVPK